jgi:hypothetical protein
MLLWQALFLLCGALGLFLGARNWRWTERTLTIRRVLCVSCPLEGHILISALVWIVLVFAAGAFLIFGWMNHLTYNLALGGIYQISDASGYWTCANSLNIGGELGGDLGLYRQWCQRRLIYPGLLATISWMAGGSITTALLIQASLVVTALFLLIRRSSSFLGAPALIVMAALVFAFASIDAFTVTMTENAGLLFGALALFALLRGAQGRSLSWYALGVALLSIGLNARAGAFFVLPALVVAAGLVARLIKASVLKWLPCSICAVTAGFVIQSFGVWLTGGDLGASHGSFAYSLYGLSTGGKGWQQVLVDHPELKGSDLEMTRAIYHLAIDNIKNRPMDFINGLWSQAEVFIWRGSYGFHRLGALGPLARFFWWISLLPILSRISSPIMVMVFLTACGTAVSAPFLLSDGGPRVFAATIPFDALQVAIGVNWSIAALIGLSLKIARNQAPLSGNVVVKLNPVGDLGALTMIGFCVLATLAPYLIQLSTQIPSVSEYERFCDQRYAPVLTRLGGSSSLLMSFADSGEVTPFKGQFSRRMLEDGLIPNAWFNNEVKAFGGGAVITAFQMDLRDPYWPGPYEAIFSGPVPASAFGKLAVLCIDRTREMTYAGHSYRPVVTYSILAE